MANDNNHRRVLNRIIGLIMISLTVVLFISFFALIRFNRYEDESVTITGNYDVTFNDEVYNDVDITKHHFPSLKKGDHVTYAFNMPDIHVEDAVLTLYLDHAAVKVFYDDALVYEMGSPESKFLGYGYVNINLPDDYAGMRVRVCVDTVKDEGKSSLSQPVINNSRTQLHNYISDKSFYLVIDITIIMLSVTIIILSIFFSGIVPDLTHFSYLGMCFFLMGLYEFCSYDLIWIFSDSLILRGYLECTTLYCGPFFLSLYFYKEFFTNEKEQIRKVFGIVVVLQFAFPIVSYILHFADIVHLPEMLVVSHSLLSVSVIITLGVLIRKLMRKDYTHRHMVIGLIVLITLTVSDLIRFFIYMQFNHDKSQNFTSNLIFGFFIFLISMIIDFFYNQRKKVYKMAKAEAMAKLADIDMMTNLANRRGCEKAFAELRRDDDIFGIVCIDLNYLKKTNDQYGHQEGDKLIIDFSKVLNKSCIEFNCTVGRMGGDEFVVIIPSADKSNVQSVIDAIKEKCGEVNDNRNPLKISYACGYCLSNDEELRSIQSDVVEATYNLADKRMYDNKVQMKANR